MSPVIPEEARNAPLHAEWLNGAGSFDLSHVGDLPAELIKDVAHDFFRRLIIAADKHRRLAARELRIDHQRIAHGIESLDKARIHKLANFASACGRGIITPFIELWTAALTVARVLKSDRATLEAKCPEMALNVTAGTARFRQQSEAIRKTYARREFFSP